MKKWPLLLLLVPSLCFGGWNPNRPAGSDTFEVSDDFIRANWSALDTILMNLANPVGFSVSTTGAVTTITVDTGQGAVECYAMNQAVRTSDSVTFTNVTADSINLTGGLSSISFTVDTATIGGATAAFTLTISGNLVVSEFSADTSYASYAEFSELLADTINTGQGATEVYYMDQDVRVTDGVEFAWVTAASGEFNVLTSGTLRAASITTTAFTAGTSTLGPITTTTINTGHGINELYPMNQSMLTSSMVTFSSVDTGQGANELYDMDQNVLKASAVTFGSLTCNDIHSTQAAFTYNINQDLETTDAVTFANLTAVNYHAVDDMYFNIGDNQDFRIRNNDEATTFLNIELDYNSGSSLVGHPTNTWDIGLDSVLFERIYGYEYHIGQSSAQPTAPTSGHALIWTSDGTGPGDQGDIMGASNVSGTTYYWTIMDYSAAGAAGNVW